MARYKTRLLVLMSALCFALQCIAVQLEAQTPTPTPSAEALKRRFGTYHETNVDLEVKVQGGAIRILRIWRGDRQEWSINPQHEDLNLSEATAGSAYGRALAAEISRGPRLLSQGTSLVGFYSGGASSGGAASSPAFTTSTGRFLSFNPGVQTCTNEGEAPREAIAVNASGYKWVNRVGRQWGQFDFDGRLLEWGEGSFRIGQVLRDQAGRERGYADTNGRETISIERDTAGRVRFIRDYTNRTVEYVYNSAGQLETVIDPDGVRTRYSYTAGNITGKRIGDASGAAPGEEVNEETSLTLNYSARGELLSIRDQDLTGIDFQYDYDQQRKLYTKTETASGNRITRRTWDDRENLLSVERNGEFTIRVDRICEDSAIIDKHNRLTYVDRDALGFIKDVYFPDGRRMRFQHSRQNWPELDQPWNAPAQPWGIVQVTFPSGTVVDYTRDANGNIVTAVETSGSNVRRWRFGYDSFGNMTEQRLQEGSNPNNGLDRIDRWQYNADGNIEFYEDALQRRWTYQYNSRGDLTSVTNPSGKVWRYFYNGKGQLTRSLDPVGYEQLFEYSNRGLLKLWRDRYDVGQEAVTRYRYNHRGLVRRITDPFDQAWQFEYNDSGEVEVEIDPELKRTVYSYDPRGRVKTVRDDNNVTIRYDYFDTAGPNQAPQIDLPYEPLVRITYPTMVEELRYDLSNRLAVRTLRPNVGAEQVTVFRWNDDNRLREIQRPDGQVVSFTWDQLGRPLTRTEPGWGTQRWEYPNGERTIRYIDPLNGVIEQQFNQAGDLVTETRADQTQVSYQYDQNGNIFEYRSSRGHRQRFLYNDAEELTEQRVFATPTATTPLKTVVMSLNRRGDFLGYNDGITSLVQTVDKVGRVLTRARNFGPFTANQAFTYTPNGRRQSYTSVEGIQHTYLWDAANNFQGIVIPNEGAITIGYDQPNWYQPTSITFPGGTRQSIQYDDLRRVDRLISTDQTQAVLMDFDYSYRAGPVSGAGLIEGITTEHGAYSYLYDNGFRLTTANSPTGSESFTYDDLGRRQPGVGSAWTYNANGAPLDTGVASYTYDLDGNRATKIESGLTTTYRYDESDRLVAIERPAGNVIARYGYDPFGARLWKENGAGARTYFDYTDDGLAAEFSSAGTVQKSYLFAPESYWSTAPLALKQGGTYHYYHNDHLGTPRKLTNNVGGVTWSARYSAYGVADVSASGADNPLRFPGQYSDPESGLYYNYQRNYDPQIGVYAEQDPYGVIGGPNRYVYGDGSPLRLYDPQGLLTLDDIEDAVTITAVGAGTVAAAGVVIVGATPVVVAATGVTFATSLALTGVNIWQCYDYLQDECTSAYSIEDCIQAPLAAVSAFGSGAALYTTKRIHGVLASSRRASRPGSAESRALQALKKKIDRGDEAFAGVEKTQKQGENLIRDILGSVNKKTRRKVTSAGDQITDIFDLTSGRGVRLKNGKFDTFVNF